MYHVHYLSQEGINKFLITKTIKIVEIVFNHLDISMDEMTTFHRKRELVEARQISMYFIKKCFKNMTLSEIGKLFNRDHATVLYSVKHISELIKFNVAFKKKIDVLIGVLNQKGFDQIKINYEGDINISQ